YVAIVLGAVRVGATVALINNHLEGPPLDHALVVSKARVAIIENRFVEAVRSLERASAQFRHIVDYGEGELESRMAAAPAIPFRRVPVSVSSDFVYIYTSGTTGLPKPSRVTHARSLVAAAGFGHLV